MRSPMFLRRIPDRSVRAIYSAMLLLGVAYGVSIAVLAIHLEAHGIPKLAMGGLASAYALGIVAFSIPAGSIVQRFGAKRTLLAALIGYAICVSALPFLTTTAALSVARFFDGAFSVQVWIGAETALLSRSDKTNKAFLMSLYVMSLAVGYMLGPILATGVVKGAGTGATFVVAGVLACIAASVIVGRFESGKGSVEQSHDAAGSIDEGSERLSGRTIFWRIKTSGFGTFAYGYFQASVVMFLPLYLIEAKHVSEQNTILSIAVFAAGMLVSSMFMSRLGDRHGHLLVMRILGAIGGTMVGSIVFLSSFQTMCLSIFVAGATLGAISPVSLGFQGVVIPKKDLGRANAFYNACFAAGMLLGPLASSVIFTTYGGGPMLLHLTVLWGCFSLFTFVFASDDPRRGRAIDVVGVEPTIVGAPNPAIDIAPRAALDPGSATRMGRPTR